MNLEADGNNPNCVYVCEVSKKYGNITLHRRGCRENEIIMTVMLTVLIMIIICLSQILGTVSGA